MQARRLSPEEVAARVLDAIQRCSYYDEHFFVRGAGLAVAGLNTVRGLGYALGLNLVTRIIDFQGGVTGRRQPRA